MTDLNYPLDGKTPESVASYLGMTVDDVKLAIHEGATTYEQVYKWNCRNKYIEKEMPDQRKKPRSTKGPFGKKYF